MTARIGLLVALTLVAGCSKTDKAPENKAGSAGPALEGSAKPQPSEAAPEGTKAPPMTGSADSAAGGSAAASESGPVPTLAWEKYVSKERGFSMELPGKPEEREQSGMKMVGAEFGVTKDDDRTSACGVAYMPLPKTNAKNAPDPQTFLETAIAPHKANATVIEDKPITLDKHPGRSVVLENAKHRKWMRVYLIDQTLFILNCGGPFERAKTDGPIVEKALGSFALTK
jgi:hypothetical protein